MILSVARFASVVPLVSARALARPFTYLADGLEKGAVVSVRFGRASRRGVVVGLEDEAPPDVEPVAVEDVLGAVPAPLVDLALWLADYYGSTPARALGAGRAARRRARRAGSAGGASASEDFRAEEAPGELRARRRRRRSTRIAAALDEGGGRSCSTAPPGAARPRSTSAPARTRSSAGSARSSSSPRSRSPRRRSAASAPASASASPSSTRA